MTQFQDTLDTLHRMTEGQCLVLSHRQRQDMRFNSALYDDLTHALRSNLMGSGWGVYDFMERIDGSLLISKHPEGDQMTLDRDGRPLLARRDVA